MAEYLANSRTSGHNRMFGHSRILGFCGHRRFGRIVGRIVGRRFCRRKIRFNTARPWWPVAARSYYNLVLGIFNKIMARNIAMFHETCTTNICASRSTRPRRRCSLFSIFLAAAAARARLPPFTRALQPNTKRDGGERGRRERDAKGPRTKS